MLNIFTLTALTAALAEGAHYHKRDCNDGMPVQAVQPCGQSAQPQYVQAVQPCGQSAQPQYVQAVQPCEQQSSSQPIQVQAVQPQYVQAVQPCGQSQSSQPLIIQQAAATPQVYYSPPPLQQYSPQYAPQPQYYQPQPQPQYYQPQPQYYQPQSQYYQPQYFPFPGLGPIGDDIDEASGCYGNIGNSLASSAGRFLRYVACPWSFFAENIQCSDDNSNSNNNNYPPSPPPQYGYQMPPSPPPQPQYQPQPVYYQQPSPQPQYVQAQQPQGQWYTTVVPVQSQQNQALQPVHASLVPDYGLPNLYQSAQC